MKNDTITNIPDYDGIGIYAPEQNQLLLNNQMLLY